MKIHTLIAPKCYMQLFCCASLLLCSCDSSEQPSAAQPSAEPQNPQATAQPPAETQRVPTVTTPTSVEDVQRMILGTWTYTGQEDSVMGQTIWEKWIFKPDGTMEDYTATASDDNWGQPKSEKWQAVAAKYSNTGKRWYGVNVGNWLNPVILKDDGTLRYHPSEDVDVEFTKGDKFPFSK